MSDETTLLPCPFCGGETKVTCAGRGGYQTQVGCTQCNCRLHEWFRSKAKAVKAWNTRAEHGTLTAEQVMAIAAKHQPDYCSDTHVCFDWQAIADELNATMGSGECELHYGENDDGVDGWYTQCGGWFAASRDDGRIVHPRFCQLCGKAVKR